MSGRIRNIILGTMLLFEANKKAIINVKNEDNKCFLWYNLSSLHPADKDAQRVTKYKTW